MTSRINWPAVGTRYGRRVVVDVGIFRTEGNGRQRSCVMVQCDCGRRDNVPLFSVAKTESCAECAERGRQWGAAERKRHSERVKAGIVASREHAAAAPKRGRKRRSQPAPPADP